MARIRMVKPEFFDDPDVADLSMAARLFFIGLWTQADSAGRIVDDMRRLKARIFPFDDVDCEALAVELHGKNMISRDHPRQAVEKHGYIWIRNFLRHQRPHPKEPPSVIPPCDERAVEKHGEPWKNISGRAESGVLDTESGFLDTESGTRKLEVGRPETRLVVSDDPPPIDLWFREFVQRYPGQGRVASQLAQHAFFEVVTGDASVPPSEAFSGLCKRLDGHIRSHQWRVKGMIPRLDRYLREGLHLMELPAEAPVSDRLSPKTHRTVSAAANILRGEA